MKNARSRGTHEKSMLFNVQDKVEQEITGKVALNII